ncbi:peptidylprolyl isomerase [Altererythrobacter sp.]|uniref:peptidylprolyl isomerase n=1 Tax=Altererythrobacter sp. TaxID=1872480 RepID=UPI001B08E355|nr:peptidylprolyl isomerase [Altererythrobacter sp.]MBO6608282.1 SurA N-terminal domain-containing protein [Altererythrobacter sp.]MBO6641462.1 SurA N-terminal domain-containing protein [Altererythrobacter sp.]MBO6707839.1 SurA N-terminal domain-containing protein [Altererythrobacter sp.]
MITLFRKFFGSKLGLGITLGFLVLIAFAFASSDVANQATFGGVSGGDRVAIVGDEKIGNADFSRAVSNAIDQVRQEDPTITLPIFAAQGGFEEVLEQMIDRAAVGAYAREYGLRAGENLVNSEILQFPAFNGPDGNFSQDAFQAALRQRGLNEATLRRDLGDSLLARQLVVPGLSGVRMPQKFAIRYASLLRERRTGAVGFVPSASFAPEGDPTEEQLSAYYEENRSDYIRPERRVLRYATFGVDNLDTDVTPTQEEIAARYERDRAQYAASEERTFTQLIVPTQDAANSIRERVGNGASLAAVAREAGFSTTQIGPIRQEAYGNQTSGAVAAAVFDAPRGRIAEPARSSLGWHVVRVDNINTIAERPLASVSAEISQQLLQEKRAIALADLSARVEEQVDSGVALSQVAQDLEVEITSTAPITAEGQIYGVPGAQLPPQLVGAVSTAFQMQEGEPQLAEIVRGTTFMIFEVSEITASAAAPLDEIRDQVVLNWRLSEGAALAREAADRVITRVKGDAALAAAFRDEATALPPVDNLSLNREDLLAQGQRIPPALALMFSMAEGTTKRLEAPNSLGWFVVDLQDIDTPEVSGNDPIIEGAREQLRGAMSDELANQMTRAIRDELGVETNPAALDAVRRQMTGETQ